MDHLEVVCIAFVIVWLSACITVAYLLKRLLSQVQQCTDFLKANSNLDAFLVSKRVEKEEDEDESDEDRLSKITMI